MTYLQRCIVSVDEVAVFKSRNMTALLFASEATGPCVRGVTSCRCIRLVVNTDVMRDRRKKAYFEYSKMIQLQKRIVGPKQNLYDSQICTCDMPRS